MDLCVVEGIDMTTPLPESRSLSGDATLVRLLLQDYQREVATGLCSPRCRLAGADEKVDFAQTSR